MVTPVHNVLRPPMHSQNLATDVQMAGRAGVSGVKTQNVANHHKDPHAVEAGMIKTLQTGGLLMPLMFMGNMLGRAVSFVVGGGVGLVHKGAGLAVKGRINGFYDALSGTTLNDMGSFSANYAKARGTITGKEVQGVEAMAASGAARSVRINAGFANATASVGSHVAGALDALDATKPMQAVTGSVTNFAGRREANLLAKGTEKAAGKAMKWGALKESKGLGALLKAIPSKLGKASLFNVVAVAGALMASSALLLGSRRENREDNIALKEFAADVYGTTPEAVTADMMRGTNAHPLVQEARKIYDKNRSGRALFNVFNVAGDALMVGNMTSAASGALMAAEMGLPAIGQMFVSENPTLSIYSALKKAEAGELTLAPEQKTQAIMQLLVTVPAIARNGGAQNAYVPAVAQTMVERGMSTTQIVQTIASPAAFQKISQEVIAGIEKEKQSLAEKAKQEAAAKPVAEVAPTMLAAAAPGTHAHAIEHKGTMAHSAALARH